MPETNDTKNHDPFAPLREVRDAYLENFSKVMIDAVNTEGYAQASGAMMDCYLTAAAPFREAVEKTMQQTMLQASLPSRQELASLAERFVNVEMRLDDMDAKLDRLLSELAAMRRQATKEPVAAQAAKEPVPARAPQKQPEDKRQKQK